MDDYFVCQPPTLHTTDGYPFAYYGCNTAQPLLFTIPNVIKPHWHGQTEIIRILRGEMVLVLNSVPLKLKEGDHVWIDANVFHSGQSTDCLFECVVFDLNAFLIGEPYESVLSNLYKASAAFTGIVDTELYGITDLFDCVFIDAKQMELGYTEYGTLLFSSLLRLLCTLNCTVLPQMDPLKKSVRHSRSTNKNIAAIHNALNYMQENYSVALTLEELAAQAYLSPHYFGFLFRELTGYTPLKYLNIIRISRARELLIYTSMNVSDISLECGFRDLSYFIRTFRSFWGVSPSKFRKQRGK